MAMKIYEKQRIVDFIDPLVNKRLPMKRLEKACIKTMPNYLFENGGHCECTACGRKFSISKPDKHKAERKCPECHKPVIVQRMNGSRDIWDTQNIVWFETIDKYFVSRYFQCRRRIIKADDGSIEVRTEIVEVGRHIASDKVDVKCEKHYSNEWQALNNGIYAGWYFSISHDTFHWYPNKYNIRISLADKQNVQVLIDNINFYALQKYDEEEHRLHSSYKPFDRKTCDNVPDYYTEIVEKAICTKEYDAAEKFISAGLYDFYREIDRWHSTDKNRFVKNGNKSILKILGFTRQEYRWFLNSDRTVHTYFLYKGYLDKGLSLSMAQKLAQCDISVNQYIELERHGHVHKVCNYIVEQDIIYSEYSHYLDNLKKVDAPMDKSNLYPKDFYAADMDLSHQLNAGSDKKILAVAKKIHKAMASDKFIKSFEGQTKGFIVKVPENTYELVSEGKKMHNCLGSYCLSVGNRSTQIFFIRKIEEPDKPFYAMEYRDGEIRQLYTYNNTKDDQYEEVRFFCLQFIDALSKVTKKGARKNDRSRTKYG